MLWDVMRQSVMLWDVLRYCVMFWDAVRDCEICWDIWPLMVRSLKCDVMRCFEILCDVLRHFEILCDVVRCAEIFDLWWSDPWSMVSWDVLRYCLMLWDVLRYLTSDGQVPEVWCYEMFWDTVWCCEMWWDIWPLMVRSLKCSGRQRVVSSRLTHARWSSTFLYSIILVISLVLYKNKQSQL